MPRFGATFGRRLIFENISYHYGQDAVLHDLNLEVNSSEILCLLGESGCGKSTLLKIAAGLIRQNSGCLRLDDLIIADDTHFTLPEHRGIGLVFQDYALFPHMNVLQNVMFGLRKVSQREALKHASSALETVKLEKFAHVFPSALSGGQKQRVALARALVPRPNILLLDEPFSNLDPMMRNNVRDETLNILKSTGATAIIVTHDAEEAMRIGDRIALIHRGKIEQIASAKILYQKPKSLRVARFLGNLNEIEGEVYQGQVKTKIGDFPCSLELKGSAIVGIRPEHIILAQHDIYPLKGRITRQLFLGNIDLLEIAVEGLEKKLILYGRPDLNFKIGQDISIRILASESLVFEQNMF